MITAPAPATLPDLFLAFLSRLNSLPSVSNSMGDMEEGLAHGDLREIQRQALEQVAQAKADNCDNSRCPQCGTALKQITSNHERVVNTRFGPVRLSRGKGYCSKCKEWFYPADKLLGLDSRATASPGVQEAAALLVSKMPAQEASRVLQRLTGMPADDSTLAREAKRQGERAKELRHKMDEEACSVQGRWDVTNRLRHNQEMESGFTLIIEMDAWLIRERDNWGERLTPAPSRWHWVYTATVFRLDQRCQTQSKRPVILSRGYVATRGGLEDFSRQVYGEAVRQGLLLADSTLVIADGGVWIWKIAEDRFSGARQRLDFYHASQHLWAVAGELFGTGSQEAKDWVEPLLHQLRHGGEAGVISTLQELSEAMGADNPAIERESNYFAAHREHLDYEAGARAGEPIGSGAIESTCRQYQCRFKRPGQFWSIEGDEALLALETVWRNHRWALLYPHASNTLQTSELRPISGRACFFICTPPLRVVGALLT